MGAACQRKCNPLVFRYAHDHWWYFISLHGRRPDYQLYFIVHACILSRLPPLFKIWFTSTINFNTGILPLIVHHFVNYPIPIAIRLLWGYHLSLSQHTHQLRTLAAFLKLSNVWIRYSTHNMDGSGERPPNGYPLITKTDQVLPPVNFIKHRLNSFLSKSGHVSSSNADFAVSVEPQIV